jgi:hypothetical protein
MGTEKNLGLLVAVQVPWTFSNAHVNYRHWEGRKKQVIGENAICILLMASECQPNGGNFHMQTCIAVSQGDLDVLAHSLLAHAYK